ncbi:hypothetical protein MMC10_001138 [Thelotrema lepadinum]|nr:hypothetical protein [Thelotrema lepadinum]
MSRTALLKRVGSAILRPIPRTTCLSRGNGRPFHVSQNWQTDGVYHELTAMRVRTPWIEAFRKQQEEGIVEAQSTPPATAKKHQTSPKKMSDSYHRIILPLAQDHWLSDNYLNATGHVRLGTLFMDLDALSGIIAYKHTGDHVMTVTAGLDRIVIKNQLTKICDLELSGEVTFATGRSSMEISCQVAKAPEQGAHRTPDDVLLTCTFTMVSLDPNTKKPVAIAPLQIDTAEEQNIYDQGERNYQAKKAMAKVNLRKTTPNDEESDLIHELWLRQLEYHDSSSSTTKPSNVIYMENTRLHSAQIMQPQYRNRHNFMIFGGYLLKQTFELAFSCAASFSHTRPTFISLDPSTFQNPVPVGSVLYLTATVAYTDEPGSSTNDNAAGTNDEETTRVQIRVDSRVRNIEHGETKPTGQFNYTFLVKKDIKVMPRTYSEFMIWVDARRRARQVDASVESVEASRGKEGDQSITE